MGMVCRWAEATLNLERDLAQAQRELSEAREQQAATRGAAHRLAFTDDLRPVFETILANATRLAEAKFGNLDLRVGDGFHIAALATRRRLTSNGRSVTCGSRGSFPNVPLVRIVRTTAVQHIPDLDGGRSLFERTPP